MILDGLFHSLKSVFLLLFNFLDIITGIFYCIALACYAYNLKAELSMKFVMVDEIGETISLSNAWQHPQGVT